MNATRLRIYFEDYPTRPCAVDMATGNKVPFATVLDMLAVGAVKVVRTEEYADLRTEMKSLGAIEDGIPTAVGRRLKSVTYEVVDV